LSLGLDHKTVDEVLREIIKRAPMKMKFMQNPKYYGRPVFVNWVSAWSRIWERKAGAAIKRSQDEGGPDMIQAVRMLYLSMGYFVSWEGTFRRIQKKMNKIYRTARWLDYELDERAPPDIERVTLDIELETIPGYLFLPSTRKPGAKVPVVLFLHGLTQTKEHPYYDSLEKHLIERGIAVLRVDLPRHGDNKNSILGADRPDDYVKQILAYLKSHEEIDGDRIGVFGFSFGGYMGMRALLNDDLAPDVKAVVALSSPVRETFLNPGDFLLHGRKYLEHILASKDPEILEKRVRDFALEKSELLKLANGDDRLRVIYGDRDESVNQLDYEFLAKILSEQWDGREGWRTSSYPGEGHYLVKHKEEALNRAAKFLSRKLTGKADSSSRAEMRALPEAEIEFIANLDFENGLESLPPNERKRQRDELENVQKLSRILMARMDEKTFNGFDLVLYLGSVNWIDPRYVSPFLVNDETEQRKFVSESPFASTHLNGWMIEGLRDADFGAQIIIERWGAGDGSVDTASESEFLALPQEQENLDIPYGRYEVIIDQGEEITVGNLGLIWQIQNAVEKYFVFGWKILIGKLINVKIGSLDDWTISVKLEDENPVFVVRHATLKRPLTGRFESFARSEMRSEDSPSDLKDHAFVDALENLALKTPEGQRVLYALRESTRLITNNELRETGVVRFRSVALQSRVFEKYQQIRQSSPFGTRVTRIEGWAEVIDETKNDQNLWDYLLDTLSRSRHGYFSNPNLVHLIRVVATEGPDRLLELDQEKGLLTLAPGYRDRKENDFIKVVQNLIKPDVDLVKKIDFLTYELYELAEVGYSERIRKALENTDVWPLIQPALNDIDVAAGRRNRSEVRSEEDSEHPDDEDDYGTVRKKLEMLEGLPAGLRDLLLKITVYGLQAELVWKRDWEAFPLVEIRLTAEKRIDQSFAIQEIVNDRGYHFTELGEEIDLVNEDRIRVQDKQLAAFLAGLPQMRFPLKTEPKQRSEVRSSEEEKDLEFVKAVQNLDLSHPADVRVLRIIKDLLMEEVSARGLKMIFENKRIAANRFLDIFAYVETDHEIHGYLIKAFSGFDRPKFENGPFTRFVRGLVTETPLNGTLEVSPLILEDGKLKVHHRYLRHILEMINDEILELQSEDEASRKTSIASLVGYAQRGYADSIIKKLHKMDNYYLEADLVKEEIEDVIKAEGRGWIRGAGKEKGVDNFPEAVREDLRKAKTFVERAVVLFRYLGWSEKEFQMRMGVSRMTAYQWFQLRIREPNPSMIKAISDALRADPIFLLTGRSEKEALQESSLHDRVALLLKSKGMSFRGVREQYGLSRDVFKKGNVERVTLFIWADILGEPPVLIESGVRPKTDQLYETEKEVGFEQVPLPTDILPYLEKLQRGLIQAWQQQGYPADEWEKMIRPDPKYHYPGLAGQLLMAKPGAIDFGVHYKILPSDVAEKIKPILTSVRRTKGRKKKANPEILYPSEIHRLAKSLAEAYKGLEKLLASEFGEKVRPPRGYDNDSKEAVRMMNAWDFIGRMISGERLLTLLNRIPLKYSKFKMRVLRASHPENQIQLKEQRAETLFDQFPGLPPTIVYEYVWKYKNPGQRLNEAQHLVTKVKDYVDREWLRPVANGKLISKNKARSWYFRNPSLARSDFNHVSRRDKVIVKALSALPKPQKAKIQKLISAMPGRIKARNFLNRIVGAKQVEDQEFFKDIPQL